MEKMKYKEKPKVERIEKDEKYVYRQFEAVGFDISKFRELHERLVELANMPDSHFDDAVKMAELVKLLWQDITKEGNITFSLEEMQLACLFHDIGKSGPKDADRQQRMMIEQIFNPHFFNPDSLKFKKSFPDLDLKQRKKKLRDSSISEILNIEGFSNQKDIEEYLQTLKISVYKFENGERVKTKEPLDLNKHSMIQLWREHDTWTLELLEEYGNHEISKEFALMASTHHALEGNDPGGIDGEIPDESVTLELLDKYSMLNRRSILDKASILTLIDKYQAFIDREKVSHAEAIEIISAIITSAQSHKLINHDGKVYNQFMKYLKVLADHPELAEKIKH